MSWFPAGIEGWSAAGNATAVLEARTMSPTLVVLDSELSGDLGGPEMSAEHEARLRTESVRLRDALVRTQMFQRLNDEPARETIERLKSQQAYLHYCNGCDLDVGRELHADFVMVVWGAPGDRQGVGGASPLR